MALLADVETILSHLYLGPHLNSQEIDLSPVYEETSLDPPNYPEVMTKKATQTSPSEAVAEPKHKEENPVCLKAAGDSVAATQKSPPAPAKAQESSKLYETRASSKGLGAFAINDIKRGQRILAESPLLSIPHAPFFNEDIEAAFEKLSPEDKEKYFKLHSAHGQNPADWPINIHPSVLPLERKRIEEQHAARIGEKATVGSIFITNCMEMGKGAGIFYDCARFNHSCSSNAYFSWNVRIGKETIHAIKDIKAGEEITLCYCDPHHDVRLRQWELKHYGFVCDCPACGDASDSGSFAALSAQRRYRLLELNDKSSPFRYRNLESAVGNPQAVKNLLEMAALQRAEGLWTAELANSYMDIALICEARDDYRHALNAAQLSLQVTVDCRGSDCEDIPKCLDVIQRLKRKIEEAKAKAKKV